MAIFEFNDKNVRAITALAVKHSKRDIEFRTKECKGEESSISDIMRVFAKEVLGEDIPETPVHFHIVMKFNDIDVRSHLADIGHEVSLDDEVFAAREIIIHPEDFEGFTKGQMFVYLFSEIQSVYQKLASAKAGYN